MNEPVWFRQQRDASDRFARVVDRAADATSSDEFADEVAVVDLLRRLGSEPVLEPATRDRMKTALLAETEALQTDEPEHTKTTVHQLKPSRKARRKASLWAAATAAGIVAFGAFGIELAQTALPGDLLYDIKRTTESISLDLTFSSQGKAFKHLEMAETRIAEIAALIERDESDGGATADELPMYRSLINDLNGAVAAASRGVTDYAPQTDGADLRALREWAGKHGAKLTELRSGVPEDVVREFDGSIALVNEVRLRANALLSRWECDQITSGREDALGALPAATECPSTARIPETAGVTPRASKQAKEPEESDSAATETSAPDASGEAGTEERHDEHGGSEAPEPTLDLPPLPDPNSDSSTPARPTERPPALPLLPLLSELGKLDLGLGLK